MPEENYAHFTKDGLVLTADQQEVTISRDKFNQLIDGVEKIANGPVGKLIGGLLDNQPPLQLNQNVAITINPDNLVIATPLGNLTLTQDNFESALTEVYRLVDGPVGDDLLDLVNNQLGYYANGVPLNKLQQFNDAVAVGAVFAGNQINNRTHDAVDDIPVLGGPIANLSDAANLAFGNTVASVLNLVNNIAANPAVVSLADQLVNQLSPQAQASELSLAATLS